MIDVLGGQNFLPNGMPQRGFDIEALKRALPDLCEPATLVAYPRLFQQYMAFMQASRN